MVRLSIWNGILLKALTLNKQNRRNDSLGKETQKMYFFRKTNPQGVLLTVLAGLIFILGRYLEQTREEGSYPIYLVAVLWGLTLLFCLWLGNWLIYRLIRRRYSQESFFNRRFFLQLILSLFYSLVCINLSYLIFKNTYTEIPPDQNQFILLNIYGILFLIPVLSIQFGFVFLQKWKKAIVEQEKLKKEQAQSELIALRSHLSPHFMFNNLNILSALIHPENQDAQDFLERFSEVYRYVLKNRDAELIALKEELDFLEAYRYLLHCRFSDSLRIQIDVPASIQRYMLPPLALQMILENALKHNKLSESDPLQVRIFGKDTPELVIQNNLQIRNIPDHEKTGFGLDNIRRRYWLTARKDIDVTATEEVFSITLPLILKREK